MRLEHYQKKFASLRVNSAHGRASPHKICMLLALLDLARSGRLKENRIEYDAPLLERYRQYFDAVKTERDTANPFFPFFHLRGDGFWHLQPIAGRETVLAAMTTATSPKMVVENIEYAYVDDELFHLLQDSQNIDRLGASLADKWFDRGLDELKQIAEQGKRISQYEYKLREPDAELKLVKEALPEYVRNPAFRRVVTEIYDYRCAATGLRILLPDGTAMVEAAHIHPFCEARDDDPRNGLALTPDMHWAMDKGLIAPAPDFTWKVSIQLDGRIADNRIFTDLQGKKLILPKEARWYPKREVLEWRVDKLN